MAEQERTSDVASSSNSSTLSSKTYDVFLSFRGEDTRLNFTSHLYKALTDEKVKTYMDNQLEKGDEISPTLTKAIKDSHVSIVIFSENYASSRWCLGELSKIMECEKVQGQIVIPIFYNIDPSHVRKQTGSYKQAFENREGEPNCNIWKTALTKAANLAGWDSQNRIEPEFLKDIVEDVLQKLAPKYPNQLKGLVGIEENCKRIESLLKNGSSEVKILGIWGMGGIGKTTLATALYEKLSHQFEGHCFLPNVREKSDKLEVLRDELFSKLLGNKNHGFDHFDMTRLQRKKVFVVLDDVDTSEQLEKLIVEHDFLRTGSTVIITTRNRQILSEDYETYPMEELQFDYSLQLFCLTVFGEKQPKHGYEDLSRKVISYCKGIPLALKVVGANLRKRSKKAWQCELRKLQRIPNMQIHNVLKLSYDSLDHYEKDIFLDIACFFKGEKGAWVTRLLEAFDFFPASGIEVLLDKALITISYDNKIQMHDLIQEMGREIVNQESIKDPGRRSRLWRPDDVLDVLKYNKGTDVVEGIILNLCTLTDDLYLSSDCLAKMTNLRFLHIYRLDTFGKSIYKKHLGKMYRYQYKFKVYFPNGLESLPNKLRYLYWDEYCLESLPPNFCAEQLVELHIRDSKLRKLWDTTKSLLNLKEIDICGSQDLIEIPDLSMAKKLESVYLSDCVSLRQLHPSMSFLPKLTNLDLSYCRQIESLNVHSKSLQKLDLISCFSLKVISVASEEMTSLELCELRGLLSVTLFLPKLTYLLLSSSTAIESLNLRSKFLQELNLQGCSSLKVISMTTEEMMSLNLTDTSICALPSFVCDLLSLDELDLTGTDVKSLPTNIKNLSMLTKLTLDGCFELVSLPKLPPSLRWLGLDRCEKLKSLPELPPLLYEMSALNCISLETEITQQLVLQHMLQSRIPYLRKKFLNDPGFYDPDFDDPGHFIFPGNHVTDECGFHTVESSITIPYVPKSDLFGVIYCIILSKEQISISDKDWHDLVKVYISQGDIKVCGGTIPIVCKGGGLISDHVMFSYVDVSKIDRISKVHDHFNNITFKFEITYYEMIIAGCGVFPVYATASAGVEAGQ